MKKFEEVNNDILKDLFEIREETLGNNLSDENIDKTENKASNLSDEDKRHEILIDEISEKILNNVSGHSIEYVKKQLDLLDDNLLDYICYWNEKYYRSGFVDGMRMILTYIQNK